jgi:hypothetical protein
MDEDWEVLKTLLPVGWESLARETGALKGLRKHKSAEDFLRCLLIHIGCGYSLRETVVRAREAKLGDFSDVALLKRLRKSRDWLHQMCQALFQEKGITLSKQTNFKMRLFDATHVKEPGKTGSVWRIHYSMVLPSLSCDYFELTPRSGEGNGETLGHFPIQRGDHIMADRGYCHAEGIEEVASKKAFIIVRVNYKGIRLLDLRKRPISLLQKVKGIQKAGVIKSWDVLVEAPSGSLIPGRVCVVRKTEEAIKEAHKRLKEVEYTKMRSLKEETYEIAKYVIVFSNFPETRFSAQEILEWYRIRWQIELVFKRFKSLAQLGHLPKHDDESAKAWLYGKLLIALLVEKLIGYARSIFP